MGFDYRTFTGLGKQTPGGHSQNLVRTRTLEKETVTSQETDPDLPVSVQESPVEAWVSSHQGHRMTVLGAAGRASISPFEGGPHYPYHSLACGHSPTCQQKIGLKIY